MDATIWTAIIPLIGSAIGTLGGIIASARLTNYRIQQLEKKVEAHNNLIKRTYELEKWQEVCEEKLKVANHRIEDLEEKT